MHINALQLSASRRQGGASLGEEMRTLTAQLNLKAKLADAPTFVMTEGRMRAVRPRHAKGSLTHCFRGGEKFRVSGIVSTRHVDESASIDVTLCPADLRLAREIASLTMGLDEAFLALAGFEDWCDLTSLLETPEQALDRAHERAATASLPSVDETRSSALWGAW